MVPAEGVLTQKSAPLAGANILVMYPDGDSAVGASDKDGKFTLSYVGRNGALPGVDLKVAVIKQEVIDVASDTPTFSGPPKTEEDAKKMAEQMANMAKTMQAKKDVAPKSLVETKYRNPETSGLKLTIPEGGSKDLKIDVP
jgi:hypothetical protein